MPAFTYLLTTFTVNKKVRDIVCNAAIKVYIFLACADCVREKNFRTVIVQNKVCVVITNVKYTQELSQQITECEGRAMKHVFSQLS